MRKIIILSLCLLISSCASIPATTMLRFSNLNDNDFVRINPYEIVVKVELDKPLELNISSIKLSLKSQKEHEKIEQRYSLKLISEKPLKPENSWFHSIPERTEYKFILSKTAVRNFENLQQKINAKTPTKISFSLDFGFKEVKKETKHVTLSTFLQLSKSEGFITLFNRAEVQFESKG